MWTIEDNKVVITIPFGGIQELTTNQQFRHRRIYFDALVGLALVLQHRIMLGEIDTQEADKRFDYLRRVIGTVYERQPPEVQAFYPGPLDIEM